VSFAIFVVNKTKVIVPGYPHGSLKNLNGEEIAVLRR